jgi:hypothetical protein
MSMKAEETVLSNNSSSDDRKSFLQRKEINVGGVKCKLLDDALYSRLRRQTKTPDDFLNSFVWKLDSGGGKGGAKMAFTKNMKYIVKELSGGDAKSLRKHAKAIVEHCESHKSFMARVLAHFVGPKKIEYVAMAAVIPDVRDGGWNEIYDLKGNRDDKILTQSGQKLPAVHMRCWNIPCFCLLSVFGCLSETRINYYKGKVNAYEGTYFHLTDSVAKDVLERIHYDTEFLAEIGLMDYSIILGIRRCSLKEYKPGMFPKGCMVGADQPYLSVHKGEVWAYYLGIIDYLQEWNFGKRCAAILKCCCAPKPLSTVPPKQYADQFYSHFTEKLSNGVHEAISIKKSRCPAPSVVSIASVSSTNSDEGSPTSTKGRHTPDDVFPSEHKEDDDEEEEDAASPRSVAIEMTTPK